MEAVVEAAASVTGKSVAELSPLYHSIDPEALDTVVESSELAAVEFEYSGHQFRVCRDSVGLRRIDA